MAQEIPFIGSTLNDGTGDTLFAAASSWNKNFTELYMREGEFKADGTLVYPYATDQAYEYVSGIFSYQSTTYDGKSWSLSATYSGGRIKQMQATDSVSSWSSDVTYTVSGNVSTIGEWA